MSSSYRRMGRWRLSFILRYRRNYLRTGKRFGPNFKIRECSLCNKQAQLHVKTRLATPAEDQDLAARKNPNFFCSPKAIAFERAADDDLPITALLQRTVPYFFAEVRRRLDQRVAFAEPRGVPPEFRHGFGLIPVGISCNSGEGQAD